MCGRYSFAPKHKQRQELEQSLNLPAELELRFNIAPTQQAWVVANDRPGELQSMEWGLVPFWSADGKNSGKLINARSEGIEEKPSFREPIHSRRCLVPADSFYEWRKQPGGRKIPYRILFPDESIMYFAGIWDEWKQGGQLKRSFSILTTTPNQEMADLHDRMPVILTEAAERKLWLSNDAPLDAILALLHPPHDGVLRKYPVSEKLNKPVFDGPELHQPAPEELRLF